MSVRRPLLRITAIAGAAAIALGLAGCGDVNAGSGALDKLHAIVDGWDETLDVDESATNTLPWTGQASATVIVTSETSDDRLAEMTETLGAFLEEEDGGTAHWSYLDLQVGAFRFGVDEDADERGLRIVAVEALRSDDRVVGGFVQSADDVIVQPDDTATDRPPRRAIGEADGTMRAIVTNDVPLTEAYDLVRSIAALVPDLDDSAVVAETEDGTSAVSDSDSIVGGTARSVAPTTSLALATAVGSAAPVSDVIATSDSLDIRLESTRDVGSVRDLFESRAIDLGIDLTVNGGVVSDDGTAYPEVLGVAQALDGVDGVESVRVSGSEISVTLPDATPLTATINTLLTQADIDVVTLVTLSAGDPSSPGFEVSGVPGDLVRQGQMISAGQDVDVLSRLSVWDDITRFDVDAEPDLESLRSLFTTFRPLLVEGSTVQVSADRTNGFSNDLDFVVADDIDIELPPNAGDEVTALAALVASAWATAD
ncbi:hypothetical protein CLV49_1580 [Labedella gwakjiensis]|uniref:Uncharacterized protein n=1 Tax=Labedella gwakjiensis TaxID=390269 RepID=A0A2P8GVH2_9MICO|nr:hypothetical protein [Labedella gwakjiensis]PSL37972.1 hypothetical protein CLV49_1580 [Labedella gwakjiensis]